MICSFYSELTGPQRFVKLAYYSDFLIGAIACRFEEKSADVIVKEMANPVNMEIEILDDSYKPAGGKRMYIMTIGVLSAYRRRGVARSLLESAISHLKQSSEKISELLLHVQTTNEDALAFYEANGFKRVALYKRYYKQPHVVPPDAYLLTFAPDSVSVSSSS